MFPNDKNVLLLLVDLKNEWSHTELGGSGSLVYHLGETKNPEAIAQLIEFTKSKDVNERRLAASALRKLSRFKPEIYVACPHLIRLLSDEKPQVRQYAVKALERIKCPEAIDTLKKLLDDEKYYVRDAAKRTLKCYGIS